MTVNEAAAAKYKNELIPRSGLARSFIIPKACPSDVMTQTAAEICANIPERFRILNVENVLRGDCYSTFRKCQQEIKGRINAKFSDEELRKISFIKGHRWKDKMDMIQHLVTPRITLHATPNHLVP
jgi:hypothetical protein